MAPSAGTTQEFPHRVTAVVPVKPLVLAKSRLALPDGERRALALAFAVDTVAALSGSALVSDVVVVTSDPVVVRRMRRLGARLTRDEGAGLGAAVRDGVRTATAWRPSSGVAVVPADLPCLRAEDVTQVLADGRTAEGAFVPDWSRTGTTLVVYPPGREAVTSYGPQSAARHLVLGLVPLDGAPVRARHDVDTIDDLRSAIPLGPGPETLAVMDGWDPTHAVGQVLTRRWQPTP